MRVNENSIAEAINVPAEGERWFKQKEFKEDFSEFLVLGTKKLSDIFKSIASKKTVCK